MKSNFIECSSSTCSVRENYGSERENTWEEEHVYANKIMNADDATDLKEWRIIIGECGSYTRFLLSQKWKENLVGVQRVSSRRIIISFYGLQRKPRNKK